MRNIPHELDELIEGLLAPETDARVFNILNAPEQWNYDYFLSLLPLLSTEVERLIVLAPEFVAQGKHQRKVDKPPRHALIAKNLLDAAITLPLQLIQHDQLPVTLMLFNASKDDDTVLFINAAQRFQTQQGKEMVQAAQVGKILSTYKRVRSETLASNELSSPVCYADQFEEIKPGVIVDRYAYLASLAEIARRRCSVSPADYVV